MHLITEEVSRKLGGDIHAWHVALDREQEEIAFRVAWAAVKKQYHKRGNLGCK